MLRLLAALSPTAILLMGGLGSAAIVAPAAYYGGKLVGHHAGFTEGKAAIVQAVNKRNAEAGRIAGEAKSAVDACDDANGTWNQTTGRCDR